MALTSHQTDRATERQSDSKKTGRTSTLKPLDTRRQHGQEIWDEATCQVNHPPHVFFSWQYV